MILENCNTYLINEASMVRLYQHTVERNIGIISASRGRYTKSENLDRSRKLESDIRASGFGFYRLEGHYIEGYKTDKAKDVKERCYLVIGEKMADNGNLKGILKKLGSKYNQDSILYKPYNDKKAYLIGTQATDEEGNSVDFPGLGREVSVGEFKPMKVGEFYSRMKGKPFVFESYGVPKTWVEMYAEYLRTKLEERA